MPSLPKAQLDAEFAQLEKSVFRPGRAQNKVGALEEAVDCLAVTTCAVPLLPIYLLLRLLRSERSDSNVGYILEFFRSSCDALNNEKQYKQDMLEVEITAGLTGDTYKILVPMETSLSELHEKTTNKFKEQGVEYDHFTSIGYSRGVRQLKPVVGRCFAESYPIILNPHEAAEVIMAPREAQNDQSNSFFCCPCASGNSPEAGQPADGERQRLVTREPIPIAYGAV